MEIGCGWSFLLEYYRSKGVFMAETTRPGVNLEKELEIVLAETLWIHEKFTAIRGLFDVIGNGKASWDLCYEAKYRLAYMGDSEFTGRRVAVRFETDERVSPVYATHDERGNISYHPGSLTMGHVYREFIGVVPEQSIILARDDTGIYVKDAARLLASGAADLSLGLSEDYIRELSRV
jgi:hypothetical protein